MRWLRLLSLGLASVYPLYWTAQFVLFFLPESLMGFWLGQPVRVLGLTYLQATSSVSPHSAFAVQWEALFVALVITAVIIGLRGDEYLTGALGIVLLGQCTLLPFVDSLRQWDASLMDDLAGGLLAFSLIVVGLYRILSRTGGYDFLDRVAILSLIAVLPQAALWMAFRMAYPYFGTRFLLLLLVPLYLGAIIAAALPKRIAEADFNSVPWTEILASSAVAGLLLIAITLSSRTMNELGSRAPGGTSGSLTVDYIEPCGTCQQDVNVTLSQGAVVISQRQQTAGDSCDAPGCDPDPGSRSIGRTGRR